MRGVIGTLGVPDPDADAAVEHSHHRGQSPYRQQSTFGTVSLLAPFEIGVPFES